MSLNTKFRSSAEEIMDDFSLKGQELDDALDKIAKINRFLGGNRVTLQGVKKLLKNSNETLTIIDAGCGNGDMLRMLAEFAREISISMRLIGIDANEFTISRARELSAGFKNIEFRCADIFEADVDCDIAICTLTLHHFEDRKIIKLMQKFYASAALGIVINDLHRSKLAYRLFQLVCLVFSLNRMSRQDGLVSILRGFKRNELEKYSVELEFKKYKIRWKWAFRFQWIIWKI